MQGYELTRRACSSRSIARGLGTIRAITQQRRPSTSFAAAEPAASSTSSSPAQGCKANVPDYTRAYLGYMPLVGMEGIAAAVPSPARQTMQQHVFVALRTDSDNDGMGCWVIDFLPQEPTHPVTAVTLLTGGSVKGKIRSKVMDRWIQGPTISTRYVAQLDPKLRGDGLAAAVDAFNRSWDLNLSLMQRDCRHYAEGLLLAITGKEVPVVNTSTQLR